MATNKTFKNVCKSRFRIYKIIKNSTLLNTYKTNYDYYIISRFLRNGVKIHIFL
ncbi:MAG: hypothetical protein UX89_C0018G0006 [Parcubacteria group bacterium GW2011_GWA2_47_16]|nr:MAG: hypothetical protein UX89_C0018G0006 [Parcubacteria group bacterium GW2011_GWA2_47_16]